LKYFYTYSNVGIVQANHVSDRNRNFFMKLFHVGVNSHWPTYQTMKHFYGFSTMLGHGAMIKRDCYERAGGFPPLVAEDLCLSIEKVNVVPCKCSITIAPGMFFGLNIDVIFCVYDFSVKIITIN
jgi:hypothetical protein